MRQAFAGMLWSKQLFDYDVARWLDGDPTQPPPPASRLTGRNSRWRNFEAFDIMSMPDKWEYPWFAAWDLGVPLRGPGPRRPGVRQVPAAADLPGVVPAPERRPARLRVGLRRRQPAGAGVGRARGVRHRRRPRPRLPEQGLRQAARQLHVVGQPRGRRRLQPVRGRLPRPRQHRADRPLAPARSAARSSSPTPPAGWRSTRWPWAASPSILNRSGQRPATDLVLKFLEHFAAISEAMEDLGVWDETDGLYYDKLDHARTAPRCRSRSARWSASSRCSPPSSSTRRCIARSADRRQAVRPAARRPGLRRPWSSSPTQGLLRGEPGRPQAAARRRRRRPAAAAVRQAVRRGRVPLAVRAAGRCPPTTATTPTSSTSRASRRRSTTSRPSRRRRCSAATPTGAARCGSRSTTSSSARSSATTASSATSSRSSTRPAAATS